MLLRVGIIWQKEMFLFKQMKGNVFYRKLKVAEIELFTGSIFIYTSISENFYLLCMFVRREEGEG